MSIRPVKSISGTQPAMEGAGVHLHRVFGFGDPSLTDPFLMMDDFRNDVPEHYAAGFPWHPHRGIETITYVLAGSVDHADSLGNSGSLAEPQYLDVSIPPNITKTLPIDAWRSAFAYIFEGTADFRGASDPVGVRVEKEIQGEELHLRDMSGNRSLVVFDTGDEIRVTAGETGVRFLLISGRPIEEPVAWHGPIVMNTRQEIEQAMQELQNGT